MTFAQCAFLWGVVKCQQAPHIMWGNMWEGVDMGKFSVLWSKVLREPGRYGDGFYPHTLPPRDPSLASNDVAAEAPQEAEVLQAAD